MQVKECYECLVSIHVYTQVINCNLSYTTVFSHHLKFLKVYPSNILQSAVQKIDFPDK